MAALETQEVCGKIRGLPLADTLPGGAAITLTGHGALLSS
jgi:hypothetical protein